MVELRSPRFWGVTVCVTVVEDGAAHEGWEGRYLTSLPCLLYTGLNHSTKFRRSKMAYFYKHSSTTPSFNSNHQICQHEPWGVFRFSSLRQCRYAMSKGTKRV